MRPYFNYTPRHWEFGLGFYKAYRPFEHDGYCYSEDNEIALMIGPFSFCLTWE